MARALIFCARSAWPLSASSQAPLAIPRGPESLIEMQKAQRYWSTLYFKSIPLPFEIKFKMLRITLPRVHLVVRKAPEPQVL